LIEAPFQVIAHTAKSAVEPTLHAARVEPFATIELIERVRISLFSTG
jgi:hypothetical protein